VRTTYLSPLASASRPMLVLELPSHAFATLTLVGAGERADGAVRRAAIADVLHSHRPGVDALRLPFVLDEVRVCIVTIPRDALALAVLLERDVEATVGLRFSARCDDDVRCRVTSNGASIGFRVARRVLAAA
jgi:hypothetical protein